jgi:mRNA-degrading endonuclease RelE of RelBE toxin-antitoxin system
MPFDVVFTEDAERQLHAMPARDRRIIEDAVEDKLVHQPTAESRALKSLRPNRFAEYELRVGDFRVLYRVDAGLSEVLVAAVGVKVGNKLFVEGSEFHEHHAEPGDTD